MAVTTEKKFSATLPSSGATVNLVHVDALAMANVVPTSEYGKVSCCIIIGAFLILYS